MIIVARKIATTKVQPFLVKKSQDRVLAAALLSSSISLFIFALLKAFLMMLVF
jgi:hypothetical protein